MFKLSTVRKLLSCTGLIMAASLCAAQASAEEVKMGGTLRVAVTPEPPGLVTGLYTTTPSQMVGGQMFESLLRFTPDLKPTPQLAESWEISEDGKVYTFNLRKAVKWHDGQDFDAEDAVFSLTEFLPKVSGTWSRIFKEHVERIEKSDSHVLVITLKHPFPPLMANFINGSMPMVAEHIYKGTDFTTTPANRTPVGTGPMKLKEWVAGSHVVLERNPDYYMPGHPRVDQVVYRFIADSASRAMAFERGEFDVMTGGSLELYDIERLSKNENVCVSTKGWEMFAPIFYLQLNVADGPLADINLRKALMHAFDRQFLIDVVWQGRSEISTGPLSNRTMFYTDDVTKYELDLDKAKEYLAKSSYKGEPLRFLVSPYGEIWARTGEIIKQNFEAIGVKVEIVNTDPAGWHQKAGAREYDIVTNWPYQFGDPANGVSRMWTSATIGTGSPYGNSGGYRNERTDQLFAEAALADPSERAAKYAEIQRILADELPALWGLELAFPTVMRCDVKDFITTATGANEALRDVWLDR